MTVTYDVQKMAEITATGQLVIHELRERMGLANHPKPRMRQVMREVLDPDDGYEMRLTWLCVGCGTYVYDDNAEHAYKRWCARRQRRWIAHQREALHKDLTKQYGKP
jgi:hypothetical protein